MQKATHSEVEDIQLAKACINGNDRAQTQLFQRFSKQMMAVCLRYGSDYDEAQDMFQDGFIKVFQKLDMYNGKGPLGAWIRRTMVNNALDHLRRNKRQKDNVSLFEVEFKMESEDVTDPFEDEETKISRDRILELVRQMPTGYRTVFNLYVVEEYSHKEIAEQLGITESTSKTQYRKAKAYMRILINQEYKEALSG
ncbi:MAG: RNA polymerase sigma factor [Cryomorphaceae bacterium]|nr:sigma-70 family RNA polymerase sigma factor [Flavobacteriales bacterium]